MDVLPSLPTLIPASYADYAALAGLIASLSLYASRGLAWDRPEKYDYLLYEKPQVKRGGAAHKRKETRNIRKKIDESGSNVVIFWGSQSGTAEGFANGLASEMEKRYGLKCMSIDLSDFDADSISEISHDTLTFFILSTFGEGDPSDNTSGLWHWIRNERPSLPHLKYMAFGLGNSNYKYFNKVVDVVTESLHEAGAQALLPVARADDAQGGTVEDFLAWKESVFAHLESRLGFNARLSDWSPKFSIEELGSPSRNLDHGMPIQSNYMLPGMSAVQALPIVSMKELCTSTASKSCLHVELDLTGCPTLVYKTGDHLLLWPTNPNAEVDRLLHLLEYSYDSEAPLCIVAADDSPVKVPSPTTLKTMLRYNLEICAPVSRETAGQLARFAPSEHSRLFLQNLAKDRGTYRSFQLQHQLNIGKLMQMATGDDESKWPLLPVSFLIESLSALKPRYYSISSSAIVSPRVVSLTVSVVGHAPNGGLTPGVRAVSGVASKYLAAHHDRSLASTYHLNGPHDLLFGRKLYAQLRKSTFKLPLLASQPIMMVATGTGLAPFRGFLYERARLQSIGKPSGKMLLLFGCQDPTQDYLYQDELKSLQAELGNDTLSIITAFSRQDSSNRVYVQDKLLEHGETAAQMLLDLNANLYVCGSAAMARDVGRVVGDIVRKRNGWTVEVGDEWMQTMKRTKRFQEDVWG